MKKPIKTAVLLILLLISVDSREIKAHYINNAQSYKASKQSDSEKIDSTQTKRLTLVQKFKEARKDNKKNLRKASKFYNPLTIIFHLFGI